MKSIFIENRLVNITLEKFPDRQLWYIRAKIEGIDNSFVESRVFNSWFTRDLYQKAVKIPDPLEYTKVLLSGIEKDQQTKCELLDVDEKQIQLIWGSQGDVQIENDVTFLPYVAEFIKQYEKIVGKKDIKPND